MTKTLEDFKTYEPVFPEAETCKTENLIGQTIRIKAAHRRKGEKGDFYVLLCSDEKGKLVSFATGGLALVKWIKAFLDGSKLLDAEDKTNFFPEEIEVIMLQKKSKSSGLKYFDFANS